MSRMLGETILPMLKLNPSHPTPSANGEDHSCLSCTIILNPFQNDL